MFYGGGDKTKVNPANSPIGHPFGVEIAFLEPFLHLYKRSLYQDRLQTDIDLGKVEGKGVVFLQCRSTSRAAPMALRSRVVMRRADRLRQSTHLLSCTNPCV